MSVSADNVEKYLHCAIREALAQLPYSLAPRRLAGSRGRL